MRRSSSLGSLRFPGMINPIEMITAGNPELSTGKTDTPRSSYTTGRGLLGLNSLSGKTFWRVPTVSFSVAPQIACRSRG